MTITLETATRGPLAAVAVHGEVDIRTAPELRACLTGALDEGVAQLVLDLSGVEFMDSSGLGILVGAHKRLVRGGSRLQIVGVSPPVARLLAVAGLARVFDVRDSTGAALVS